MRSRELLARTRDSRGGTFGRLVAVLGLAILEQLSFITGTEHVRDVEKCGAFDSRSEIDERRLHAWENPRDLAPVDVPDHSSIAFTLNKKFSEGTLFDNRDAGLGSLGIDHEHVLH